MHINQVYFVLNSITVNKYLLDIQIILTFPATILSEAQIIILVSFSHLKKMLYKKKNQTHIIAGL